MSRHVKDAIRPKRAEIGAGILRVQQSIGPGVVRIRYEIGEDWSGQWGHPFFASF